MMKKYLIILFLSLGLGNLSAQYTIAGAPSLDAALGQMQGQEAQQWGEEAQKFGQIIEQAKKAYEIYSQVSDAIKSFKELKEFMKSFAQITTIIKESTKYYNAPENVGMLTPDEIKMIEAFYKGIGTEMEGVLSVVEQSSKQDNKMTMGERIKGIHIAFEKLQKMMQKVIYFNTKITEYVEINKQEKEELDFLKNIYKFN